MEKVKYNYLRLAYFLLLIGMVMNIIFLLVSHKLHSSVLIKELLTIFAICVFRIIYERYGNGVAFNSEKVIVNSKINSQFLWKDVEVELDGFKPSPFNYGIIYLKSKSSVHLREKIEINWFTEESVVRTIQKYTPIDHELYLIVKDYAEKRGLNF